MDWKREESQAFAGTFSLKRTLNVFPETKTPFSYEKDRRRRRMMIVLG